CLAQGLARRELNKSSGPAGSSPWLLDVLMCRCRTRGEKITHTGQVYDEYDYRRIRFVGRQKDVNENFAIDLIAEQPTSKVERAPGHPKVYINLGKATKTGACGYCGLEFKQHHHP
uniref:Zinc finger CHCC-type domain-containing protein n=1 Tax=Monodelphis domestica TaxID=13616 RepID=A0A5F8HGU3_MONDO